RPRPPPTWSSCARPRGPRSSWRPPSTTPTGSPASAPGRGTTRSSSSAGIRRAAKPWPRPCSTSPTAAQATPYVIVRLEKRTMADRVVLAYSGGLDTSVAIPYLAEKMGAEVIAVAVDVGQGGEDMEVIRKRALDCGAVEAVVVDAREEFARDFCFPALRANALYMDRYPLVSALSRPLIVKHLAEAARKYKGTHVAHGCTGKGNDQVRF